MSYPNFSAVKGAVALLFLSFGISLVQAQTKQLTAWQDDLAYLQTLSAGDLIEQRDAVAQILTGVEFWLKLHPHSSVILPSAPEQPWSAEQMQGLVSSLRDAVQAIQKEDPGRPFELGVTEVSVTAETSPLSPVTDSIDHTQIRSLYAPSVTQSIQYLPGLSVDHKSARGQNGIMIRGFDTRQVGFFLDGIPIYVPFDGFGDVSRFLTSDIGEIEVAKGYSSPLMGPNGLGGAVNLVTREPEKKLEADAALGTGSGEKLESWLHLGSRWKKFFFRGGMDWLQTDFYPISGDFSLNSLQPNYDRSNSDQRDVRYTGRLAWTPRGQDQYVLSYANQKADYGAPPYSGSDTVNNKPKYQRWSYWNKESYYFNSNTGLGETGAIKFRAFYDHYPNAINQYTDGTYTALSNITPYNDHSAGTSADYTTRILPRQVIGAAFFFKDDTHKESATTFSNSAVSVQPWRTSHDQLFSLGVQDSITISSRMRAIVGFSADHLNAVSAEDLLTITTGSGKNAVSTFSVVPFSCPAAAPNNAYSSCLAHVWDYNPLASLSYAVGKSGNVYFTFAQKSHFPTLKDRYSYKNGKAIPNPTLQPEHARNYSLGYSHAFAYNTLMQVDLFRSDVYDAIENAIIPAQFPNQCPGLTANSCQQSVNVGKELHQGAEVTLRSTPLSRLTVDASYSFLQRSISGPPNMPRVFPTGSPKHKTVGTATVRLPHQALVLASARYEAGTITTNDSGFIVPASKFATADLGLILPIHGGASLQTGVKNLFDRNYYYQEGFPESGRNWYFSMRYRF